VKKRTVFLFFLILTLLTSLIMSGCMLPFLGNEPVVIVSDYKSTAIVGVLYNYQVEVDDDGKTELVFELVVAPDGMTIDRSTGLVSWTPTESQIGEHEVNIKVSDGWYKDNQEFSIEVSQIKLSSISVVPPSMKLESTSSSQSISSITAFYTDGSSKVLEKTDCSYVSSNTTVATVSTAGVVTAKANGNTTVTVSYTEEGITKSASITVTVTIQTSGGG
jgi:uncharacterized protein YjdB